MNLVSCDHCAVILDSNKLRWPLDMEHEDGSIDLTKADYNQQTGGYAIYVHCPVCRNPVFQL